MKFLHVTANDMYCVAAIHEGITRIHTIIQITSQILLKLFIAETIYAELTKSTFLMSTNPQWRRLLVSSRISHTYQNASRSTSLASTPDQKSSVSTKSHSTGEKLFPPSTSSQLKQRLQKIALAAANQNLEGAKSKRRQNDFHRDNASVSNRCLYGVSESFLNAPRTAISQSGHSTIKNTPSQRKQPEDQPEYFKPRHRNPHLKEDPPASISRRTVTQDSDRSPKHNQLESKKKLSNFKSKRRSKTESLKSSGGKVQSTFPVTLRKRQKKKKKIGRSKDSSSFESSEASEQLSDKTGWAFKVTAAGQHGFMKNASTGSDSLESSFTVVNIDQADLIKDQVQKTSRVVGTSIQKIFLSKRGVHFPLPNHRSVGIQADGSDNTPRDAKTLFQKLLPRISALSTKKRRQTSINASGQSSYSDFSNSRSYHDSQSLQSGSERGCTTVEVQYAASGSVKAILRVSPNLPSKYSSRCSAILSGDRLAPIIQGVSLASPPRTLSTNNSPKTSKSAVFRSGPARTRL